jgi:ribosomal protein S18 acetylase RimI-like enzyme
MTVLIPGYSLKTGSGLDRAQLVKFMQRTYRELDPTQPLAHLSQTVDRYLSNETPLWWVIIEGESSPIACLWLGSAIDQVTGDRHSHVLLLYVMPNCRRQGIGAALMRYAEQWAKEQGDRQIGLQVFSHNQPALTLYHSLGYAPQSIWMVKPLNDHDYSE